MLYSWYQDDVWLEGSLANRMMQRVNAMHRHVADQVREIDDLDVEVEKVFRDADIDCEAQLSDQDRIGQVLKQELKEVGRIKSSEIMVALSFILLILFIGDSAGTNKSDSE